MKKISSCGRHVIAVLFLLFMAFPLGCGDDETAAPDTSVHFKDPNLEAAVRDAIGKPTGPIYPTDLNELDELSAPGQPGKFISDLGGIEYCTNLSDLSLEGNSIYSIDPLRGLIKLDILKLADNIIEDITPLEALLDLDVLELQGNHIRDIAALKNLIELGTLKLGRNYVGAAAAVGEEPLVLAPLGDLTELSSLDLGDNLIRDVYGLVLNSDNGGLGSGDSVTLVNNPLSPYAIEAQIEYYLKTIKQVAVTY